MDKKSIICAIAICGFTSSIFANSTLNKLLIKHTITSPTITKSLKKINGSHPDFSGTWVGSCDDNAKLDLVIENDNRHINFNGGQDYIIGKGLQGEYQNNDESNNYEHIAFEWSQDGSSLAMQGVFVAKENTDNSPIFTMLASADFTLKNGQLNLDQKIVGLAGVSQLPIQEISHCVFSKK